MSVKGLRYVYGPVPSRRLGRSLGVDIVPFKVCTYDCIYCQLGSTTKKTVERREYVPVQKALDDLDRALEGGGTPDYISVSGSGEPTLNSGIGRLIHGIKERTRIPVAVLTNGSLLWDREVQDALMGADLVLPSLDAGDGFLFQHVNRPHEWIPFEKMVGGIAEFTSRFEGSVWLEVFLLGGVTGIESEVRKIAALVERIRPERTQLNTVERPPAEEFALPLPMNRMQKLAGLFPHPVDIIAAPPRKKRKGFARFEAGADAVLALLKRRPCTPRDVADGLAMNVLEVIKHLEALTAAGKAVPVVRGERHFYTASGPKQGVTGG